MQVASVPPGLVSTQVPLIFRSTRSAKLSFFQKAAAVVVIVEFTRFQDYEERREGAYARDELNIRANAASQLLSKSSVQKGGAYFLELTVYVVRWPIRVGPRPREAAPWLRETARGRALATCGRARPREAA